MSLFRRRGPIELDPVEELRQQALSLLVARYPSEYIEIAIVRINELPNGGSRLPWRYRRQFEAALDLAEHDLIELHPAAWDAINDVLAIRNATPDDFLDPETP